jgi:DNA-binding transcriptional regulator YiaG
MMSDFDNVPLSFATPEGKAVFDLRWTRLGLSQRRFADRFGIPYATVQNVEQGRGAPKPLARLVLAAITADPDFMRGVASTLSAQPSVRSEDDSDDTA